MRTYLRFGPALLKPLNMDWLKHKFGLTDRIRWRNEILRQQAENDGRFAAFPCPAITTEYFLWARQRNREMTKEYSESLGMRQYFNLIDKHLLETDLHNSRAREIRDCFDMQVFLKLQK